jgi:hypothetical protein
MPRIENYVAEVTVSVVLRTTERGQVTTFSVTRTASGLSAGNKANKYIDTATETAAAAARIVASGVNNAEDRRLK